METVPMRQTHRPSNHLRFVERKITVPVPGHGPEISTFKVIRVLQQLWSDCDPFGDLDSYWADVPLEVE